MRDEAQSLLHVRQPPRRKDMLPDRAVTVVLSTHNRAHLLRPSLEALLAQSPGTPPYEVIVVDNNSTDETAAVVSSLAVTGTPELRYLFEGRQGLSHARNAGVAAAASDIVAFTDDDVSVDPHWVGVIATTFAECPEIQCLGGRTLPLWPSPPPRWLTPRHWIGPLALQDYGSAPMIVDARRPRCLAGANFAFRRKVFDTIGGFSPEFPRAQDTEFLLRLYRTGFRALYIPEMLAHARVQPDRLTKAYHRRWHSNIGRFNALMQFEELGDPILGLRDGVPRLRRIFGVPAFAVRLWGVEIWRWLKESVMGRESEAFLHENRARSLASYMRAARSIRLQGAPRGVVLTAKGVR